MTPTRDSPATASPATASPATASPAWAPVRTQVRCRALACRPLRRRRSPPQLVDVSTIVTTIYDIPVPFPTQPSPRRTRAAGRAPSALLVTSRPSDGIPGPAASRVGRGRPAPLLPRAVRTVDLPVVAHRTHRPPGDAVPRERAGQDAILSTEAISLVTYLRRSRRFLLAARRSPRRRHHHSHPHPVGHAARRPVRARRAGPRPDRLGQDVRVLPPAGQQAGRERIRARPPHAQRPARAHPGPDPRTRPADRRDPRPAGPRRGTADHRDLRRRPPGPAGGRPRPRRRHRGGLPGPPRGPHGAEAHPPRRRGGQRPGRGGPHG